MAKGKGNLVADVLGRATNLRPGPAAWVDQLPEDLRRQLLDLKNQYRRGELSVRKYSLARAIRAAVSDRGFRTSNDAGIVHWLNLD